MGVLICQCQHLVIPWNFYLWYGNSHMRAELSHKTVHRNAVKTVKKLNTVLLYNTGNYIQYHVINHHGKEYEKECIHTYN